MLETLKLVKAAVPKASASNLNPAMMYYRICSGTIQATNGNLTIQAPLPTDLDCTPHAEQFFKAISACEDVISMNLEAGKLVVRSGKFKTYVDCCDNASFPAVTPSGAMFPVPQPIVPILKKLIPFVSTDERRPWACGVYFVNNSAIATNSICMVEHWLPFAFPVIANIPRDAINELIRLKMEPVSIQANTQAVTFNLPGGAWMSCALLNYEWPDVQAVFAKGAEYQGAFVKGPDLDGLLEDISKLDGFTKELGAVYLHKKQVATVPEGQPGTFIDSSTSPGVGAYKLEILTALRGIADCIGFGAYPATIPFFGGDSLRGVFVGFQPTK